MQNVFNIKAVQPKAIVFIFLTEEGKQGNGRGNRRGGRGKEGDNPENLIRVLRKADKKMFFLECTFGRSLVMIQEPDSNTTHFCLSKLFKLEGNCTCWELLLGRGGRRREESKAGQHKDSKVGNDSKQRNYPSATGCHISVD